MSQKKRRLTPARLIALGFLAVILTGTGLLMLPMASKGAPVGFLDALFTATSATCVTGLVVADTFLQWTGFGQGVLLVLIQLGGLGFMTVITLLSYAVGKRLGLYDRKVLMQSAGNMSLGGVGSLIRRIVPFTFVFELAGAALLAIRFVPAFGWGQGLWFSLFHAVSAFCNAGFDLLGGHYGPFASVTGFADDPLVLLTLSALIVIGGLGFLVWRDMMQCGRRPGRWQLHTKLVLSTTGALLLLGTVLFATLEWNGGLEGLSVGEKLLGSFFQSVTPRTAGFDALGQANLSEGGSLLTQVLMLIGGSPGSTAGGIKTTTVAVLVISAVAASRGRTRVHVHRYAIDRDTIRQASSIFTIYLAMVLLSILCICGLEPQLSLKAVAFEVCSAIATVGLSVGITPELCAASHVVLIILMYAGRIGGLSFVLLFAERRAEPPRDRPTGKLLIG